MNNTNEVQRTNAKKRLDEGWHQVNLWLPPKVYELLTKLEKKEYKKHKEMIELALEEYARNNYPNIKEE